MANKHGGSSHRGVYHLDSMVRPSVIRQFCRRLPSALLGAWILAVWLIGAGSASAATAYTWNVAGGGSWGTSTNWSPNGVLCGGSWRDSLPMARAANTIAIDASTPNAHAGLRLIYTLDGQ